MNPSDMTYGHYYWRAGELYLCTAWISKEENGWGNAKLRRIYPKPQVSGAWYCFKHWTDKSFRRQSQNGYSMTPFRQVSAILITLSILYSLYRGDDLAVVLSLAILPMCFMTGKL